MAGDQSATGSQQDLIAAVAALRTVLAAIDAGELSCSAGFRHRLVGAVVALESLVGDGQADTDAVSESGFPAGGKPLVG